MRNILYVEEEAMNRDLLRMVQRRNPDKFNLTMFEDSWDFLKRLLAIEPPPELILVDVQARPLPAVDLLAIIRQQKGFETTPVVSVTTKPTRENIQRLKNAGFYGVLRKPLKKNEMLSLIDRIMSGEQVWQA